MGRPACCSSCSSLAQLRQQSDVRIDDVDAGESTPAPRRNSSPANYSSTNRGPDSPGMTSETASRTSERAERGDRLANAHPHDLGRSVCDDAPLDVDASLLVSWTENHAESWIGVRTAGVRVIECRSSRRPATPVLQVTILSLIGFNLLYLECLFTWAHARRF